MTPERIAKLESIPGWFWDPLAEEWERNFQELKRFAEAGRLVGISQHSKVPAMQSLGRWVTAQRIAFKKKLKRMTSERIAKLESISGWSWSGRLGQD